MVRFKVRVRFELGYREWRGLANLSTWENQLTIDSLSGLLTRQPAYLLVDDQTLERPTDSLSDIPNNLITYLPNGQPTNLLTYPHDCPTNWLSNQPIDLSPYWPTFPITKWPIIQLNDLPSPWLTNQIKFSFLHRRPTYLFPKYFLRCLTANLLIQSGF